MTRTSKAKLEINQLSDVINNAHSTVWDFGNQVLYDLCACYPKHDRDDQIIAKIWLIGRSYAAAIERTGKKQEKNIDDLTATDRSQANQAISTDHLYEKDIPEAIKKRPTIDDWLADLSNQKAIAQDGLDQIVLVHKKLVKCLSPVTRKENRSFASKYLHFHKPDLFFIYDSRAREAINAIELSGGKIGSSVSSDDRDGEYYTFCCRALQLRDDIERQFGKRLSPRQLDNLLLQIYKERVNQIS